MTVTDVVLTVLGIYLLIYIFNKAVQMRITYLVQKHSLTTIIFQGHKFYFRGLSLEEVKAIYDTIDDYEAMEQYLNPSQKTEYAEAILKQLYTIQERK